MFRLSPLFLIAILTSCSPTVQTTSGAAYLAQAPISDPAIRQAAAVEPNLRFPARIGIARVVNGRLTLAPPEEAALFAEFTRRHGAMGEWVPVSPLIEGMLATDTNLPVAQRLRRTAARQHLDYLLVYELGARSARTADTPFALADVTLIGGAILPTRATRAIGIGNAAFLDVRNGYPYGTVSTTEDLSGLARSFGTRRAEQRLQDRATRKVAQTLLPEVDEMLSLIVARAR
ncbi:MAG: hypothetical protein AAFY65_05990 [Pseudomonadota bacterium]